LYNRVGHLLHLHHDSLGARPFSSGPPASPRALYQYSRIMMSLPSEFFQMLPYPFAETRSITQACRQYLYYKRCGGRVVCGIRTVSYIHMHKYLWNYDRKGDIALNTILSSQAYSEWFFQSKYCVGPTMYYIYYVKLLQVLYFNDIEFFNLDVFTQFCQPNERIYK